MVGKKKMDFWLNKLITFLIRKYNFLNSFLRINDLKSYIILV